MSGICAIFDLEGRPLEREALAPMLAAAPYRARDGVRSWRGDGVALAFQATHVTPEDERERQPLEDRTSGMVLVADARIDAREELTAALGDAVSADASRDRAPTDAALLLAAVRRWGENGLGRVVGDFAFVTWDPRTKRVVAARDPMGMRQLSYRWDGRRLWLATEVRQVLAADGVPRTICERSVANHLVGRFDDLQHSPYEGILRLPPGHVLVADAAGIRLQRFWDVDPDRRVRYAHEGDYVEAFRDLFADAVRSRLRSTRPVGVLLSGGVDSGSAAAMAGALLREGMQDPSVLRTYSWAFDELAEADERHISDRINDHFGFTAVPIDADELWPLRDYPEHGPTLDGPFFGPYQPLLDAALTRARWDGVGVMLSGNRGDLLVGELVHDVPGLVRHGHIGAALDELRWYARWRHRSLAAAGLEWLVRPVVSDVRRLLPQRSASRRRSRRLHVPPWIHPDLVRRTGIDTPPSHAADRTADAIRDVARRGRCRMVFSGMQFHSLAWDDRIHAQAGLALADPWSDRRLAEFVIAAPQWVVHRLNDQKRIARMAMRGVMPETARAALTKINPHPLFRRSLTDRAVPVIERLLTNPVASELGFIDAEALHAHYAEVRLGATEAPTFWWALSLEMWLRHASGRM